MGDDLLRSKSIEDEQLRLGRLVQPGRLVRARRTAWKSGLPNAAKDQANWPLIRLSSPTPTTPRARPTSPPPRRTSRRCCGSARARRSSGCGPGRRHEARGLPERRPGQVPGLIVMTVTDGTCAAGDLDPARDALVVIVNADKVAQTSRSPGATGFTLHPVLAASADAVVKTASVAAGTSSRSRRAPPRFRAARRAVPRARACPATPAETECGEAGPEEGPASLAQGVEIVMGPTESMILGLADSPRLGRRAGRRRPSSRGPPSAATD